MAPPAFLSPALPPVPVATRRRRGAGPAAAAFLLALALAAAALFPTEVGAQTTTERPNRDLPLARFLTPEGTPAALGPLFTRVLEALRVTEAVDREDEERQLRRLRTNAIDVLATEGYFSAQIQVAPDDEGLARYVLRVTPGPRAEVVQVDIEWRGAITQQPQRVNQLNQSWTLPRGQPFRNADWNTAKTRLLSRVQERDFAAAQLVDSSAEVDADTASVRLRLRVDSGPAFTVGRLQIEQLERYEPELIERYNPFSEGDPYDATKLLDFQRRLQSTQYFASVLVDFRADPAQPDRVPIQVSVTEAKRKRVGVGIGYSTNTGPRGELTFRQARIFDWPYTLQTGGGIDRTRKVGYADLLLPPKPSGATDSIGVLGENTDIQNVATARVAFAVARANSREVEGATYDTRASINLQRESRQVIGGSDGGEGNDVLNDTLYFSYTWTRRRVDSITDPRNGDVFSLTGAAGVSRNSLETLLQANFFYTYGRYVRYWSPSDKHQFILRGELGQVFTEDLRFVPSTFQFRAGGAGSVRGYSYQSLGLKTGSAVQGSSALATGSAEYVHWFNESWGGALFYDVGDAADDLWSVRWARGYGAGMRWRTVAGPLALDAAYGDRERRWRVHFSIAVAF